MKRLVCVLVCAIAIPAFSLTRTPRPGDRIGVLRTSDRYSYGAEHTVAKTVENDLCRELRALGFHAFDARMTYEELSQQSGPGADFFVEVVSSQAANHPVGGAGVGGGGVALEVGVVVARVAAEVRVYEGRTLKTVGHYDLQKNNAAVLPMGIGVGGRSVWAFFAIPFVQYGQYRAAAHDIARQAAERIAGQ